MYDAIRIMKNLDNGKIEEKTIFKIDENVAKKFRLLGEATGVDVGHCLFLAYKHKEYFYDRVRLYRFTETEITKKFRETTGDDKYITMAFYE